MLGREGGRITVLMLIDFHDLRQLGAFRNYSNATSMRRISKYYCLLFIINIYIYICIFKGTIRY